MALFTMIIPAQMRRCMAKKYYGVNLVDFTVCHVWPGTCYNQRYHTCYANLVCIPAAIHSLTDFNAHVEACLKYRAYELYGWKSDEADIPEKPENYPTEWLELPVYEKSARTKSTMPHKCIGEQVAECSKALGRLAGVYTDDSIVHEIIQRALDLGCSDEHWVYMDDLAVGRANRNNIQSMKTENGNSYGRYFDGKGRGEDAKVCFVPEIWQQLKALNWAK